MEPITVKYKVLDERAKVPAYATPGSAAADLCAVLDEPLTLQPMERVLVPTGLAIELPGAHSVALVYARSGLSIKHGLCMANGVGVVDFWARWCPYCRRIAPAFDKVGEQYADTLVAGKINYDEEPQLIQRFGIDTIPTLMLFKDGKVLGSVVAPASKAAIETFIRETLAQ